MYILSVGLVVLSNVAYHITQKNTPEGANPFGALLVTYITAAVITVICMFFYKTDTEITSAFRHINWTSIVLGFAIVGLELGYLLMYRSGWNISIGSLVANILLALVLVPIGIFFYKDNLSLSKIIGILLCAAGLIFINK